MLKNPWFILAALFISRIGMGFQFQTIASVSSSLVAEFGFDYTDIGSLIGLYMLPGIVLALPGGLLGRRFGDKPLVLVGFALMILGGVLNGLADGFWLLALGRLLGGTGAMLMNVLMAKMITDWFAGGRIVTAMSVLISSWPLGLGLGLVFFGPLAEVVSWQAVMYLGSGVSAAGLLIVAVFYRPPDVLATGGGGALRLGLSPREWQLVAISGVVWALYNVAYIIIVSFGPDLFVANGYTLVSATLIISFAGWIMIPLVSTGGYLAERSERPQTIMVFCMSVSAFAMAAMALPGYTAPAFVFAAVMMALPPGVIMSLPTLALAPENRAPGMGIFLTFFYGGMAALPPLAGWTRDFSGSEAAPILFGAGLVVIAVAGVLAYRLVAARHAVANG